MSSKPANSKVVAEWFSCGDEESLTPRPTDVRVSRNGWRHLHPAWWGASRYSLHRLAWVGVVGAFLSWPLSAEGESYFHAKVDYETSEGASAVAVADMNNDGKLDLVASYLYSDSLSVHFGRGDGTFEPGKLSWIQGAVTDFAVGNFNGDQWLDVVVPVSSGNLVVGLGDGTGIFTTFVYPAFPPLNNNGGVVTGDLNSDFHLDVVITNYDDPGSFTVLLGNGDGTFQPYAEYPTRVYPSDVALGDFNGDTVVDIAVTNSSCCPIANTLSIFPGIGNGAFDPRSDLIVCDEPLALSVGDINADGFLDLVTPCSDGRVSVRIGAGNGTFFAPADLFVPSGNQSICLGDFNNDTKVDIAIASANSATGTDSVTVFPGNGNGTFGQGVRHDTGEIPLGITAADLDGDSELDLVTANVVDFNIPGGSLSVLLNCWPCVPTSISVALQDARTEGGVVHLRWAVPDARSAVCTVFRRTATTDWAELGPTASESAGLVAYEDHSAIPGERYAYRLLVQSARDQGYSGEVWVLVPAEAGAPLALRLDPVFPNPFQTLTRLNFAIPGTGPVRLAIFDVTGRHVVTVLNQDLPSGWRSVAWDGRDRSGHAVPSGAYFAKLEQAGQVQVRKVLVSR